jgi:hypothetical protein
MEPFLHFSINLHKKDLLPVLQCLIIVARIWYNFQRQAHEGFLDNHNPGWRGAADDKLE